MKDLGDMQASSQTFMTKKVYLLLVFFHFFFNTRVFQGISVPPAKTGKHVNIVKTDRLVDGQTDDGQK